MTALYCNRAGISRRSSIGALIGACSPSGTVAGSEPPIRLAVSESLLPEINVSDAKAAMLVWIQRIGKELGLHVEYGSQGVVKGAEIYERLRSQSVDAVAINAIEYRHMASMLDRIAVVGDIEGGAYRYQVLVKRGSGIRRLVDLRGRSLTQLVSPAACLGPAWISASLAAEKAGLSREFFSRVDPQQKPAKVVLPVFFGHADACLTTQRIFRTMCDLNPQLAAQLEPVATSPDLVSTCYVFRKNYRSPYRDRMIAALSELKNSPSGQQVMMLFQFDELKVRDVSCMDESIRLLDAAERIEGRDRRIPG